jgi:predicted house-cleaning noncanonical NTP pyrophosphatase (MazG superfamily)
MKLVRDKIPEIMEKDNEKPITKIADKEEYKLELIKKLKEETDEFIEKNNAEELIDILEVIYSLAKLDNISKEELENKRIQKSNERGSFNKRIILLDKK